MTPEQLRALADEGDARAEYTLARTPETIHRITAALRAAADQLEAVQRTVDEYAGLGGNSRWPLVAALHVILTADTTPQRPKTPDQVAYEALRGPYSNRARQMARELRAKVDRKLADTAPQEERDE